MFNLRNKNRGFHIAAVAIILLIAILTFGAGYLIWESAGQNKFSKNKISSEENLYVVDEEQIGTETPTTSELDQTKSSEFQPEENITPAEPISSDALYPSDFIYQGAFLLPSDFDWGARDLAYYPVADSLLVTGPDPQKGYFAEVSIPKLIISKDHQKLLEATMLTDLTDFGVRIVDTVNTETAFVSGIEYVQKQGSQKSDKLYGSIDQWYGVTDESHPTIWFSELNGSSPKGPFHVGPETEPFHGNKSGDYLFSVPSWYANQYLDGRNLITGKTRGVNFGSQGPTLLAFKPWDNDSPNGNLDAVAMLWYRLNYDQCAAPNVTNKLYCDYPEFTMCDKWEGGSFVENGNRRAIMLIGQKGLGNNNYGVPPSNSCMGSKGYYCDPYERQIIFYDVDSLGEVASSRNQKPWTIKPYAIWRPTEFLLRDRYGQSCGEVGGMTFDQQSKRLFVVEKGIGDNNSAVVHVWKVK